MLQRRVQWALVLAVAVVAAACVAPEEPAKPIPGQDRVSDEAAIRSQVVSFETAMNRRDFAALAAMFTDDGDVEIVSEPKASGQDAIRRAFEAESTGQKISISVDDIRFLNADVAIINASARLSGGGQDRGTWVMVRSNDARRLAALRVLPAERR